MMNSVVESGHQYASTFAGSKLIPTMVNKNSQYCKFLSFMIYSIIFLITIE